MTNQNYTETITLTICDQAENHVGMQKLGEFADEGFNLDDLFVARDWFDKKKATTEIIDLNYPITDLDIYPDDEAYVLIIHQGIDYLLGPKHNATDLFNEQVSLEWDYKAMMYGRVVNKHARHNLCFGADKQEPNYESGKGRIIAFDDVPLLKKVKSKLSAILKETNLVVEGNHYYDITKCGIGFHGDSERKKVIGVRLGATIPLDFQWFNNSKAVGARISLQLNHGDIYIMSEKATGNDWKKKLRYTLRHAAGSEKYLKIN